MLSFMNKNGVSLIELVVVMAILVMTFMASFSLQTTFLADSYVDVRTQDLMQSIRLAQMRAITGFSDSAWGVYFNEDAGGTDDSFTVFKGVSYAARDVSYDSVTDFPESLSLANISLNGGGSELVFEKISGETADFGSVEISSGDLINTISINAIGVINVE